VQAYVYEKGLPNMEPFDSYSGRGRALLGLSRGSNCRREYGLAFMQLTGQKLCAYCGSDFTSSYEQWLTMELDHVVPANVCKGRNIPKEWSEDFSNTVLACATCNGFCNRYSGSSSISGPDTLEAFYDLRNTTFAERKTLIAARREEERQFFDGKPWELRPLIRSNSIGASPTHSGLELRAGSRGLETRGWTQLIENKMVGTSSNS
jgi:hypothetical protein